MEQETVDNPGVAASGGAGVSAAQMIAGTGAEAVLTGNCGPNAYQVLSAAGIDVMTGVSGKVTDAIQDYLSGRLKASPQPSVAGHFGLGRGGGMGRGQGRGAGRM
jgi:predicted Fe-Mo cluster-binding NifX family protein